MNKELEVAGSKTRQKVLDFLIQFFKENGYAPSVREICEGVNLGSTSSVYSHLMKLDELGMIQIEPKKTRAIKIVGYEFRRETE